MKELGRGEATTVHHPEDAKPGERAASPCPPRLPGWALTSTAPDKGAQHQLVLLGLAPQPERLVLGKLVAALEVHKVDAELAGP